MVDLKCHTVMVLIKSRRLWNKIFFQLSSRSSESLCSVLSKIVDVCKIKEPLLEKQNLGKFRGGRFEP